MTIPVLYYQPDTVTDTTSNGGRMSNRQISPSVGGVGNFSAVSVAEQAAGVIKRRKVFVKVADPTNPTVINAYCYLPAPSSLTDTRAWLVKGTQRDQQAAMGSRKYATGILNTGINAGDTELIIDFELGSGADLVIQTGDVVAIVEGATKNIGLVVDTVSWSDDQATITLTSGVLNAFTNSAAVASCVVGSDSANSSVDNVTDTFTTSTYDDTLIETYNLSTDEQTVTLTISGSTTFTVMSDRHGALPDGSTASDYAPTNSAFALPFFTLPAAGWGGTQTVGETFQFQIHPAAIPVWVNEQVFAGAGTGIDEIILGVRLEA